jgi:hypothetical protein
METMVGVSDQDQQRRPIHLLPYDPPPGEVADDGGRGKSGEEEQM